MKKHRPSVAYSQSTSRFKYPPSELIGDKGDELERHWATRILKHIPHYAVIWETYVGNDGADRPLPMRGATMAANETRRKLWERSYTLFESIALCWSLEKKLILKPEVGDLGGYVENLHHWMAFFANLGRIRDMALKIADSVIDERSLATPFAAYYEKRCIVLHGPKVPMKLVGNFLTAPELGEKRNEWNDKRMKWGDLTDAEFKVLSDVASDTIRDLEPIVDEFFRQVARRAETKLQLHPVDWSSAVGKESREPTQVRYGESVKPDVRSTGFGSGISFGAEAGRSQSPDIDPT